MPNLKKLIAALALSLLAVVPFGAHAGYAQLKVPPGWSPPKTPGTPATFKTGPAANDNTYKGSTVLTNAALEVGGQLVTVPVSMRLAANAATIGATYAFGNPAVFAALTVGSAAYLYYKNQGLEVEDGKWVKNDQYCVNGTCYEYSYRGFVWGTFAQAAAEALVLSPSDAANVTQFVTALHPETLSFEYRVIVKSSGQVYDRELSVQRRVVPGDPVKRPIGDTEFHTTMDPIPVPLGVPQELPDVAWPYEQPVINPNPSTIPSTWPSPESRPESQPFWVPTGDPVKNPNPGTNPDGSPKPDTWTQPGKDVKPAGSPTDPWRVDVTDNPKTKNDPSPNTETPTPTTTTPTPSDVVTCGLPGKPKCLIDETGTPQGDPKLDGKKAADDAIKGIKDLATDPVQKLPKLPDLSWSFQLPSGCSAISIPAFAPFLTSINVCQFQPMFHDIMGVVWVIGGLFGAISMFWRNTLTQ